MPCKDEKKGLNNEGKFTYNFCPREYTPMDEGSTG
jgi:hypothetical protein